MRVIRRRRLEAKTDFRARIVLLESGKVRLVVRKTNRYIIGQFIESEIAQDKILFSATSKILLKKGWPKEALGALKSRAAAYLTGLVLGKLAKEKVKEAIVDIGLQRNISKSRIYALVKGVIDAGIKINCGEEALPNEELIRQGKFGSLVEQLKEKV